ncbi:MAG: hypothetical protein DSY85_03110 [Marinomonas sp.]|nr:MAG: hypothetical protein DSY85_03110 [Marinomonas sp.]
MSLKPCRECKQEVSNKAKTCPHCGVKNPASSFMRRLLRLLLIIFGIFFVLGLIGAIVGEPPEKTTTGDSTPATEAEAPDPVQKATSNKPAQVETISSTQTTPKEVPFSERPLINAEERDQLIIDMSNFYFESAADLLSHYSSYKNRDRSVFILWHNNEWLPSVKAQEEHFESIISTYQIGVTNQDFFPIRGAIGNLSHISLLLMQSIRDNNPDALETARMHLRNGMTGVGKTIESLKLQQHITIPDAIQQQANN